ncbi:hypothetical protein [Treponema primitia]|uniref:hypothetical protein n=1 Tax=Treponema primitia TaxID=88058 RepID=UPI000255552C|nr:hypothetical protein [Treponema primitia]
MKKAIHFYVLILLCMISCSGRIDGNLRRDGSAELSLEISLEDRMTALIRSLAALGGTGPAARDAPVIDGPAIARSMAAAPGIESVNLVNRSPSSIAGNIRISQIDRFLALPAISGAETAGGKRFITYIPMASPGDSRLLIAMDRSTAPLLLAMISEDVRDYLSALMAPAATGEPLSRVEYLDLVGSFYGKALADEIAAARITASIGFPGTVSSVKGGSFSRTLARFDIPLVDLLVLENPLEYEVVWRQDR